MKTLLRWLEPFSNDVAGGRASKAIRKHREEEKHDDAA